MESTHRPIGTKVMVTYIKIVKQSFSARLIDIVIQHSCIIQKRA